MGNASAVGESFCANVAFEYKILFSNDAPAFDIIDFFSGYSFFRKNQLPSYRNRMLVQTLFVFFSFLLFFWILGYYRERLTNTLIPVIVCIWLAALRQKITEKKMIFKLGSLAFIWHLYVLTTYGPFY